MCSLPLFTFTKGSTLIVLYDEHINKLLVFLVSSLLSVCCVLWFQENTWSLHRVTGDVISSEIKHNNTVVIWTLVSYNKIKTLAQDFKLQSLKIINTSLAHIKQTFNIKCFTKVGVLLCFLDFALMNRCSCYCVHQLFSDAYYIHVLFWIGYQFS